MVSYHKNAVKFWRIFFSGIVAFIQANMSKPLNSPALDKKNKISKCMHPDLAAAIKMAYQPSGLMIDHFAVEAESEAYAASEFKMNDLNIKFRVAKITPTKTGQFVTLWKRTGARPIEPFDMADPVDLFVISVRTPERFGQFVFSKRMLCEKGVVSKNGKGGKRAIRVYPPWDITNSKQAARTQEWQLPCFFEIPLDTQIDISRIQKLFVL